MSNRIKLAGDPWAKTLAISAGPEGQRFICDVRCRTRDGRYFVKSMIDITDPRRWCQKVGRVGSIDPQHWTFEAYDDVPAGHDFRDLADAVELGHAGY